MLGLGYVGGDWGRGIYVAGFAAVILLFAVKPMTDLGPTSISRLLF